MSFPIIAIVGRPNVGKSTLWNRLVGGRRAIVEDEPNVTRDRLYGETEWLGHRFTVVDTGGWLPKGKPSMGTLVREQTERAIAEAACTILVVDAREELTSSDKEIARYLRDRSLPVVLAANKVDENAPIPKNWSFTKLGFKEAHPIAAISGTGVDDLLDAIVRYVPEPSEIEDGSKPEVVRLAFVGRPNVGKSSLVNALLKQPRAIVDSIPGTTRDSTDTALATSSGPFILVDTAGLRKRTKVDDRIETYSADRSIGAISRCDIAALVLNAAEGVATQDAAIGDKIARAGRGCIIVLNQWDRVPAKDGKSLVNATAALRRELPFLAWAPIVTTSAITGQRVERILALAAYAAEQHAMRLSTSQLNKFLEEALDRQGPPTRSGRAIRIKFATQVSVKPPTIIVFANHPEGVTDSYLRYLENRLRSQFGFEGTPIRFEVRGGSGKPVR